ncbi:MAG: exonuclease domain-containing protein [Sarcina sp.]
MDFVSIDFETANEKRTSACSIGITVVKNNKIVEKFQRLIKPKENIFKSMNIWIHGITEEDVEHELEFKEIWPQIKKYIENNLVIAHNAYFDIDVLISTLAEYNILLKNCTYLCTVDISKRVYEGLPDNRLSTLGEVLKLDFTHHRADDDSMIAAKIFLDVCEYLKIEKFSDIKENLGITPGLVFDNNNSVPVKHNIQLVKKEVSLIENKNQLNSEYFKGKTIVFTGPLKTMSRAKAFSKVRYLNGITSNVVNSKTNILVTNLSLDQEFLTSKLRSAKKLIDSGLELEVLSEKEFLEKLEK